MNTILEFIERREAMPDPDRRVIAYSPVYPPGHEMRHRVCAGQFIRIMTEVESWAYCDEIDQAETILPTVHMNGTGINTLRETYDRAAHALEDFIPAWSHIEFNSRDYYVQGDEAWNRAVKEREAMNRKIREVRDYLNRHREHLHDQPG